LIGISLYVVQSKVWDRAPAGPRPIFTPDIEGGAWFDDIAVLRLPRIYLACKVSGSVFSDRQIPTVIAEVSDSDERGLKARLVVRGADGEMQWQSDLPVRSPDNHFPEEYEFPDLGPGVYTATLYIFADGIQVRAPHVKFAKLGPDLDTALGEHRGFGIVVDNEEQELWPAVTRLTDLLGISGAKVSMWREGRLAKLVPGAEAGRASYLAHLSRKNGLVIGTLGGIPRELGNPNENYGKTLLDLFNEAPTDWGPFLKYALARYAPFVAYWQIGTDGDPSTIADPRLRRTVSRLTDSFSQLITNPLLAAPWSVQRALTKESLPSAALSIYVPKHVPATQLAAHYKQFENLPIRERWLTLETLDMSRYDRRAAARDFVKRVVSAKATGADIVFTEQPWATRRVTGHLVVDPDERFLLLRTLSSVLGNSLPVIPLRFGQGVQGYLFDRHGVGVAVLWNDLAGPEGTRVTMHLGGKPRRISPWGEVSALATEGERYVLWVTQMPTIYDGVSTRLMTLRGALRLEPSLIESSLTLHEMSLSLNNPYREPISGRIRLDVPVGWEVSPMRFEFSLGPGETFKKFLTLRFPQIETAGKKLIMANLSLDVAQQYELQIPLELELGIRELGVTALAQRIGTEVIVRQRITNFSTKPVNYRSYLVAPDRPRQTRLFANLHPGQTAVKEYRFAKARDLIGRRLRVGLREVDGSRLYNQIIEVP
jgi:hypothetical protein